MSVQPVNTDFSTGRYDFDRVFNSVNINTRAISEFYKLAQSEFSYIYTKGDGTLKVESRDDRTGLTGLVSIPKTSTSFLKKVDGDYLRKIDGDKILLNDSEQAIFDNDMISLESTWGKDIVNQVNLRAFTKSLDTSLVVLYSSPQSYYLPSGKTIKINGRFTDPNDRSNFINGYNMVDPVATTDYLAFDNADGTGTNRTANITVTATYCSNLVSYRITSTVNCYITFLQARGNGIYNYSQAEDTLFDQSSIDEFGTYETTFDQKYQTSLGPGTAEINAVIAREKDPHVKADTAHFIANQSSKHMYAFLRAGIGDLVHIKNNETGIDLYHFIQGVRFTISPGGIIEYWWKLKEMFSFQKGLSPIAVEFRGAAYKDAIVFGEMPHLANMAAKTITAWIYYDGGVTNNGTIFSNYSDSNLDYLFYIDDGSQTLQFYEKYTSATRVWRAPLGAISTDTWVHIAITKISSSNSNPVMYVNGSPVTVTALNSPLSPAQEIGDETGNKFFIGNVETATVDFEWGFDGKIKDVRLYDFVKI